jgi:molybdopterin-containing oxidoreductase family iron-sulfur binding subunit
MRGTVEKCTFCAGRWHEAKEKAAAKGRNAIEAGDYVPACVEACGAGAITFGDLNQRDSAVADRVARDGAFRLLETLETGGRIYYHTRRAAVRLALTEERA